MKPKARSRTLSLFCAPVRALPKTTSKSLPWPTVRRINILAVSFFFPVCRWQVLIRSIKNGCGSGFHVEQRPKRLLDRCMSQEAVTIEKLQQLITRGPFNRWLDFTVVKAGDEGIEIDRKSVV